MRGHPNNRKGNANTVNRRVVATSSVPSSSGTSLSDRFSKIAEARKLENTGVTNDSPRFSVKMSDRLGTLSTGSASRQDIQQRLGNSKKNAGGIRSRVGGRIAKKTVNGPKARANPKGSISVRGAAESQARGRRGKLGRGGRGGRTNDRTAFKSKDDLDKELDNFMMKDEKTAKTRLDDELEAYMNTREANDEPQSMETDS